MSECIYHAECASGFCKDGVCQESLDINSPCKSSAYCPSNTVCNEHTARCWYENKKKEVCASNFDCPLTKYCKGGSCIDRVLPGGNCVSPAAPCLPGYDCIGSNCEKNCIEGSSDPSHGCPKGSKCRGYGRLGKVGFCEATKSEGPSVLHIALISIGSVIVGIIIIGLIVFCLVRRRRKKRMAKLQENDQQRKFFNPLEQPSKPPVFISDEAPYQLPPSYEEASSSSIGHGPITDEKRKK